MNDSIDSDEQTKTPKITFDVSGILPIHDDISLVLVADGSVRWTIASNRAPEADSA